MSTTALQPSARQFVNRVLASNPTIAVFDCDGTLWSGDSGADFFYWEIKKGLIPKKIVDRIIPRYDDYKRGNVGEIEMCGEMVQIHQGIRESELRAAARNFFKEVVEPRIFTEFQVLTSELAARGCELWAVSSTNNWVVEEGAKRFGIPAEHVLAACVVFEGGIATDRLARVPSDEFKAVAIREVIARPVDAVFGNSVHDLAMLEIAKTPYAINPNPDLAAIAVERGWTVYWPGN